jgi:hypothetical protein
MSKELAALIAKLMQVRCFHATQENFDMDSIPHFME